MFHDCKRCGRSIPADWQRCGECEDVRDILYGLHSVTNHDERRRLRFKGALALARMRRVPVTEAPTRNAPSKPKPTTEPVRTPISNESAFQILSNVRHRHAIKMRRGFTHENVRPSIEAWLERED